MIINMSVKREGSVALFVLITLLSHIPINCVLNEGFNDCFRICLSRFATNREERRVCTANCKKTQIPKPHNQIVPKEQNNTVLQQNHLEQKSTTSIEQVFTENGSAVQYFAKLLDHIDLGEFEIVLDNENTDQQVSAFTVVPQPKFCGFKSIKDITRAKLLGAMGLGRIVGGVDAEQHEFPWVVSIQMYNPKKNESVHFCGGAIITKNFIITAAHCMQRFVGKEKDLAFKLGVINHKHKSEQQITATKVIVHEAWDSNQQINDISLIRVRPDIKFTTTSEGKFKVNALCLPKTPSEPNGNGVLAGWGELAYKTGVAAEWLQKVTVPFVERDECHETYRKYLAKVAPTSKVKVVHTHICAGGKGNEDACRGDSGGSLIQSKGRQFYTLGLVSFSVPCAVKHLPTIYTNVVYFMDWIYKNVVAH